MEITPNLSMNEIKSKLLRNFLTNIWDYVSYCKILKRVKLIRRAEKTMICQNHQPTKVKIFYDLHTSPPPAPSNTQCHSTTPKYKKLSIIIQTTLLKMRSKNNSRYNAWPITAKMSIWNVTQGITVFIFIVSVVIFNVTTHTYFQLYCHLVPETHVLSKKDKNLKYLAYHIYINGTKITFSVKDKLFSFVWICITTIIYRRHML